jgi:hypothetical protein
MKTLTLLLAATMIGCGVVTVRTDDGTQARAYTPPPRRATRSEVTTQPTPASTTTTTSAQQAPQATQNSAGLVTVTDRFPQVTEADAMDLGKIKTVIDRATPDMIYSVGSCQPTPFFYIPTASTSGGITGSSDDPDFAGVENTIGTAGHPYAMVWTVQGEVRLGQRMPTPLAPNTPVLIWHADLSKGVVVAVTFDGGRYRINGRPYDHHVYKFTCGATPMFAQGVQGALPPPLQHYVLTSKQISALEAVGQMSIGTSQKIEDARAAASACTDRLWKSRFDARDKANTVANITESTRQNRREAILADYRQATPTACGAQKKRFDDLFEAAINANKQRRMMFYQSVSAKLNELTLPK